jgi:uroporphyrinogen decarboxylase
MTSLQRVLTTLGHREPDRVPLFLLVTMHGAKELGVSIQEYFSNPDLVVAGQLRLRAKYRHDCLYGFFYAPLETEAFGGEVIFRDDGPPNSGEPIIRTLDQIRQLSPPRVEDTPCLRKVLSALTQLKIQAAGEAPVIGVVMSPFSLPVMQLGFERYLDVLLEHPDLFAALMKVNVEFCVAWANAQLAAGATAICYFDPISSTTIVPRDLFLQTGKAVAREVIARIQGPVAYHLASGACGPILPDLAETGAAVVGISAAEDLSALKRSAAGKISLLGNLNGIAMRRWTPAETEAIVKTAIAQAGPGGGFILSDNHGEIPFQVPDSTLMAISEAVFRWGTYPLTWTSADAR